MVDNRLTDTSKPVWSSALSGTSGPLPDLPNTLMPIKSQTSFKRNME